MKNTFRNTLLTALLVAALPAHAAIQNYSLNGTLDSGILAAETFSGLLSFDDAALTGAGTEWVNVSSFSASFHGVTYSVLDADLAPEVGFENGTFLGLSASFSSGDPKFSFIAGSIDSSDAFVAYDTGLGNSGAGSVVYAPVPEPETYAMMLAGLGLLGLAARRRKQSQAS
ncbi:MAG: FxDxF family PEP-CTERM protein [Sulfuritalea sp.]|nr:FxDxF family PEP-CTERM protein [Sulfuritalea sp.]